MTPAVLWHTVPVARFSPRNYRGTKALAQKMGMDTGWNSAISLQPPPPTGDDVFGQCVPPSPPHPSRPFHTLPTPATPIADCVPCAGVPAGQASRRVATQRGVIGRLRRLRLRRPRERQRRRGHGRAPQPPVCDAGTAAACTCAIGARFLPDVVVTCVCTAVLATQKEDKWDHKAKLPHGIAAIRRHLQLTDDVPLLVSLFTDSTPSTVCDMMRIMQENGEVRLACMGGHVSRSQCACTDRRYVVSTCLCHDSCWSDCVHGDIIAHARGASPTQGRGLRCRHGPSTPEYVRLPAIPAAACLAFADAINGMA